MSTLTSTRRAATLPRVNLLPPEIAEVRRLRRVKSGLGAGVVMVVLAVLGLYLLATRQVASAQEDLEVSQARQVTLQRQSAQYAEVPLVQAQVAAAQSQLTLAMGREVRWSYWLNDLSLTMPKRVWLTQLTLTQTVDAVPAAGATTPATAGAVPATGIAQVTFAGKALSHDDVAAWLDGLARQRSNTNAYLSSATKADEGGQTVVTFQSTASVTESALSKRYTLNAGQ